MTESMRTTTPRISPSRPLVSELGWSTESKIVSYGHDLTDELLGQLNLGGMGFLGLTGRIATPGEDRVFNALLVALVEHGQTPSAIVARLTYLGAPDSVQGAVAAGLLGLGSVFVGSIEGAARLLQEGLDGLSADADLDEVAEAMVTDLHERKVIVPGVGHPKHKPVDPRSARLFAIAHEEGVYGRHSALLELLAAKAADRYERELPINATGAIGAIASDLGLPWRITRGLGVMARAVGLVAHILEESSTPMAGEIWSRVDTEVTEAHAPTGRRAARRSDE